jgi:N-acetylated-alpha-linked acidic dipeptidase
LNALTGFENASKALDKRGNELSGAALQAWNQKLYQAEQQLLSEKGLPRRPWYKHTLYAPGFYTGYGVKTLPGIREAIEQENYTEANEQIVQVAESIKRLSNYLNK